MLARPFIVASAPIKFNFNTHNRLRTCLLKSKRNDKKRHAITGFMTDGIDLNKAASLRKAASYSLMGRD